MPGTVRIALFCLLCAALSACTQIPRPGPAQVAITEGRGDVAGFTMIPISGNNVQNYLVRKQSDSAGVAGLQGAPQILLASGDVLRIKISESKEGGLFAPLATGGTAFDNVLVDYRGTISLPYAGRVPVAGVSPLTVQTRIQQRLASVAFQPQVYVELMSDRNNTVLVSGEVKNPGRFSLLQGPMTMIDAISQAGGATKPPHQVDVVLRRGKNVERIPLSVVQGGNNRQLRPGDELVLELNAKVFNALGAVTQVGQVEFTKLYPTLLDALSQVGGLKNELASSTGVFVFRLREPKAWRDDQGQWHEGPAIFRFDMAKPEMFFMAQVFGVKPNDTIYVTNAPSIEWERAIRPIALGLGGINGAIALGQY